VYISNSEGDWQCGRTVVDNLIAEVVAITSGEEVKGRLSSDDNTSVNRTGCVWVLKGN
jgi:hypothetical protein